MNIIIDGKDCECEKGEFIREVARRNGIFIPGLCHHQGLPGQACCRLCLVEVVERGRSKIISSCIYPIDCECEVYTESDLIKEQRGLILTLLAKCAPESKEIAGLSYVYAAPKLPRLKAAPEGKCIICGLCARACQELGAGAISTVNRGIAKEIAAPYHEPNPACIGCGSCAAVCPTNAIEIKETGDSRIIWQKEFVLHYCQKCGNLLGTIEETAFAAQKAGQEESNLCEKCRQKSIADDLAKVYSQ